MSPNIAERRYIDVMVRDFRADHDVADFQTLAQTARAAGIDDAVRRELMDNPSR